MSVQVWRHISRGHINSKGKAVGWHHRPEGRDPEGRRIAQGAIRKDHKDGVYSVDRLEMQNEAGDWVPKPGSTFFPDSWTPGRVAETVEGAWRDKHIKVNPVARTWRGQHKGFSVAGFYHPPTGEMRTAWPKP